ncbi:DUF5689 domain-containing protein [Prevotella sp. E2-28]|uniref:DUF5689 domain-containing protein n=1 Tax=Prevotella sp. E2-28 TaxID=2913620 RepID=UPI001EDC83F4|nr:DUF5689 domain-containing protein [Prevotella sp. E2-28]UKK52990.1 DUF5689 domain-containing protein [Prevotella sp. E2-28]
MKKIQYLLLALVGGLFASCMDGDDKLFNDDWSVPDSLGTNLYGNPYIKETNLVTIAQLKSKFNTEVSTEGKYKQVTEPMQIKAYVTANDIQGNMYNEISVQDETGAIFIGIAQGGVYGYLAVGQEILIELKDLYIGNYRLSATIGTPYTSSSGDVSVSRMPRALWQQHFTYTGKTKAIEPEEFSSSWDLSKDAGKLCVIKGVSIKKGGYYNSDTKQYVDNVPFVKGESTFSHPDYSTSWYFNELTDAQKGGVQIYTSNYADFAAMKLPTGKMNLTGVIKRYRDQWELIIRSIDDVEVLN